MLLNLWRKNYIFFEFKNSWRRKFRENKSLMLFLLHIFHLWLNFSLVYKFVLDRNAYTKIFLLTFWLSVNIEITPSAECFHSGIQSIATLHARMLLIKSIIEAIISGISLKILEHNVIIAYLCKIQHGPLNMTMFKKKKRARNAKKWLLLRKTF